MALRLVLGMLMASLFIDRACGAISYHAFSLNEAQRQLQMTGRPSLEVSEIGGITRPMALVLDEVNRDVLLVGEADPSKQRISMDDAVVAIRAVLKHGTVPLISIDRTATSQRSGAQVVRFEGGIENTRFGRDLLESDVVLKKLGLGVLPGAPQGVKSYAEMAAERWKSSKSDLAVMSRFWFMPSERSQVATNRGVAFIDHLSVAVLTEVIGASQSASNTPPRDEIAELFAGDINRQMDALARAHPAVGRLGALFRVTGLMQVLGEWRKAYGERLSGLNFWTEAYQVRKELTADRVDLLKSAPVKRAGDEASLTIDGGIDLTMLLTEWKEGSSAALRQLVLLSRPATNSLVWMVPLDEEPSAILLSDLAQAAARNQLSGDEAMTLRGVIDYPDGRSFAPVPFRSASVSPSALNNLFVRQGPDLRRGPASHYASIPSSSAISKEALPSRFEMSRYPTRPSVGANIPGAPIRELSTRSFSNERYSANVFRNPLSGWDPQNTDFHAPKALESLGIARGVANSSSLVSCERPSAANTMVSPVKNEQIRASNALTKESLNPLDHVTRVEALKFSDLVYDGDFGSKRMPDGWKLLRSGDGGLKDSPLRWAVYERLSDGQRVLSFAGTRSAGDWADNVYSSSSEVGAQRLIRGDPLLYKALGLSPHFQYDQAYQKALNEIHANKYSGSGRSLVLVGDSKGGGEVEYVSAMTKTPGIVRNPAPLGDDLRSRIPEENKKWANNGGVLRLELKSDPVSKVDVLPGSVHLGKQESYEIPTAWRDEFMHTVRSPNPVQAIGGMAMYSYYSHTERDLLLRAVMDKEGTPSAMATQQAGEGRKRSLSVTSDVRTPNLSSVVKSWNEAVGTKSVVLTGSGNGATQERLRRDLTSSGLRVKSAWAAEGRPAYVDFKPALSSSLSGRMPSPNRYQSFDQSSLRDLSFNRTLYQPARELSFNQPSYRPADFSGLRNQSFRPSFYEPNVKGVLLQGAAQVEGGTVGTGELGLVFQNSDGQVDFTKLRRFATALWAAYLSVEGPGISIDPMGPKENTHHVRHIGCVRGTDLGRIMRETDYLMKRWFIGTHRPDIPGFLNPDDISAQTGNRVVGRPSRFWLLSEGLAFRKAGGMLVLSAGRMTVQTEYLDDERKGEKNPENERVAKWFTDNYDQISEKYPIYQELFEYAQLVGLGTYLKEQKMPLLWFLLKNREMILTERAVDEVPALRKQSGYKWFVNCSGGVELEATKSVRDKTKVTEDAELAKTVSRASAEAEAQPGSGKQVSFTQENTSYTVSQAKSLSLSGTRAGGDTVQTDFANFEEYKEGEGANSWKLVTPGLELIRHYSPELNSAAQFGPGWHLAVPFELTGGSRAALEAGTAPRRLELHNTFSGEQEAFELKRITNNGVARLVYAATHKGGFIENVAFLNGAWLMQDRLGATLRFDSEGYLTQMDLRPDVIVPVKLGDRVEKRKVPGYSVRYEYRAAVGTGARGRRLDKVVQGLTAATLEWDDASGTPRIKAVRMSRSGGPAERVGYEYGTDGRLSAVQTRGGATRIQYRDNGMRVVASAK